MDLWVRSQNKEFITNGMVDYMLGYRTGEEGKMIPDSVVMIRDGEEYVLAEYKDPEAAVNAFDKLWISIQYGGAFTLPAEV